MIVDSRQWSDSLYLFEEFLSGDLEILCTKLLVCFQFINVVERGAACGAADFSLPVLCCERYFPC